MARLALVTALFGSLFCRARPMPGRIGIYELPKIDGRKVRIHGKVCKPSRATRFRGFSRSHVLTMKFAKHVRPLSLPGRGLGWGDDQGRDDLSFCGVARLAPWSSDWSHPGTVGKPSTGRGPASDQPVV